jgi:alkylhydroperoxidase family enzyme
VWKHHVPVACEFGVSNDEIDAVRNGKFDFFTGLDRALLCFAEAMVVDRTISAELWTTYSAQISAQQVIDLISLVSQYVLFALTNNVLQVPLEEPFINAPSLMP